MYYDEKGRMVSAGAEALAEDIVVKADEEGWVKVQW